MTVAIISDSHGSLDRLEECLRNLQIGGVVDIVHAGDFLADGIIELLEKFPDMRFQIARGNCDVNEELLTKVRALPNVECEELLEFELIGKKFAVAHRSADLRESPAEILINGHTHIPVARPRGKKLFLNPGSLMDDGGYFLLDSESLKVERKFFNAKIDRRP